MLVVSRFVQGSGAALMTAVLLGMIVTIFTDTRERAIAIGAFGFIQAAGGSIGTVVGGVLAEAAGWHAVFFLNVPIGLIVFVSSLRILDSERGTGGAGGADIGGAALVTSALVIGIYTVVTVDETGWLSAHTAGFAGMSAVLLGAFVWWERRADRPLLPLRMLRSRALVVSNVVVFLMAGAMFGYMIVTVLLLRGVLGHGARDTGLAMLPTPAMIGLVSLGLSARLIGRFGHRRTVLAGLALVVAGLALLGRTPVDAEYVVDLLPPMMLIGIGFGAALPAVMATGMDDAAPEDSGLASGLLNTMTQFGGAIGLSVLTVLAATRTEASSGGAGSSAGVVSSGGAGLSVDVVGPEALLDGYRLAYVAAAVMVAAAWLLVLTTSRRAARAPRTV